MISTRIMDAIVAHARDRSMRRGGSCGVSRESDSDERQGCPEILTFRYRIDGSRREVMCDYSAVIPAAAVISLKLATSACIIARICFGPR